MTITYANGQTIEGILLSHNEKTMRVVLKGSDDVTEFASVKGTWISENLEPVRVCYEWQRQTPKALISVTDCVCSKELAARLVHLLWSGDEAECQIGSWFVADSQTCGPFPPAA